MPYIGETGRNLSLCRKEHETNCEKAEAKKSHPLETLRFLIFQGVGDRFCLRHLPSEESRGIPLTQKNNENFFRYFFCIDAPDLTV